MESFLTQEEKGSIETAAFCAYIMHVQDCSPAEALQIMAKLCAAIQVSMGLGDKSLRRTDES
jgi:hypothetical protein